jgi:hypothetical protein
MVGMTPDQITTNLEAAARSEVEKYVGLSSQERLFPLFDAQRHTYAVVGVPKWPSDLQTSIVVLARVVDQWIVIEEDTTDKPLYEALMGNAGVPREQIILAYAGEKLPETDVNGQ